ncbi:MAG TPA: HlyD family efflux transporter periplasmic adaptor subunit [Pirellulales bacterium]|nr:HlyD family efflux transporter periplasmic adaptor subunit [Pirellulales bacterium]
MSTEQSVDPHLIEQTKQQIRSLVVEIAQLAKRDIDAREFYGAFLDRVVSALAAAGGAVWTVGDAGALELQYQINFRETRLADNQQSLQRHGMLLQKTMASGEGALVAPHSGEGDGDQPGNPTEFLLVLGLLKVDREAKGLVEIFQRPGSPPTTQRGYLKFLLQMCELASEYLKNRQFRHFTDRQTLWNQLENFSRVAHTSLEPRETAYTIANEGRRLIECDRVSVAVRHGRRCEVEAVSGQDTFDKRSNVITLLNRLATAVVAAGEPLWYSGDTSDLAPQVEEAVQAYVDESHSKHVAVLPLKRPVLDPTDEEAEEPETVGALIVEQIEDARPREGMVQRVNVVCEHSSLALANSIEHNSLFLMPVWRALGKAKWVVSARTLPKTVSIAIAVVAVLIGMFVIPVDFSLTSDGKLQPVDRREVFAAVDGTVDRILVNHGERVKKGQLLLEMKSTELDVAILDVRGKLEEAQEGRAAAIHIRDSRRSRRDDQDSVERAEDDIAKYDAQIKSFYKQLALLQEKKQKTKVTSPIDGIITTWDFERELLSRPVKPGDSLLTVAYERGEWELELDVPEYRMGHITMAQRDQGPELPVTYHLATEPGANYEGRVQEVHESAEVRGEDGSVVSVKIKIDKEQHPELLRPGANVKARIYCGRSSVGYWLFHDAIGFLESRVLFPMNM